MKISEMESGEHRGGDDEDGNLAGLLQSADRVAGLAADLVAAKRLEQREDHAEKQDGAGRAGHG